MTAPCGGTVGAACMTCELTGCSEIVDRMLAAMRAGHPGKLPGRDAAIVVAMFGGTLTPTPPEPVPGRRLRLV